MFTIQCTCFVELQTNVLKWHIKTAIPRLRKFPSSYDCFADCNRDPSAIAAEHFRADCVGQCVFLPPRNEAPHATFANFSLADEHDVMTLRPTFTIRINVAKTISARADMR